jgi:hypothetical protein
MATTQDILIAARALNLDGGEGSGVRGHTTALNKREEKFVASAVQGAKLRSPSQSAAIDANRNQIGFREAQAFASRDADSLRTHEDLKAYYEGLHDKSIAEMRSSNNPYREELASHREKEKQASGERHEKLSTELKASINFHTKLADKLKALGDH